MHAYAWDGVCGLYNFKNQPLLLSNHSKTNLFIFVFRRAVYGMNEIIVPMRSVMALLFLEVLNPFYIFQIFSFTLWIVDNYVYYALCILAMSCCSIVIAVIQTRKVRRHSEYPFFKKKIYLSRYKLYLNFRQRRVAFFWIWLCWVEFSSCMFQECQKRSPPSVNVRILEFKVLNK